MKPIDYRNESWANVQERVTDLRQAVYRALCKHGPCTTRALASASRIDILTLRPRITELFQIGLVELVHAESGGCEGIYKAIPWPIAQANFEKAKREATDHQLQLSL